MARALLKNYLGLEGQGEVTVNNEELFAAFEQVDQAQQVVDEVETDIDSLEASSQGLESIVEDLQASLENGGLDTTAAAFAEHAVTAHVRPLGLEGHSIVPSLESFGGYTGREASTQVSIEGISDTIKKIWAAIKAAVQKAIKAVADFFAKIFGGIDKVIKKLEDQKKELIEMQDTHELKGKAEITVPNSETLRYKSSLSESDVAKGISELKDLVTKVMSSSADEAVKIVKETMAKIKAAENVDSDEKAQKLLEDIGDLRRTQVKRFNKLEKDLVSGDKVIVTETSAKDGMRPDNKQSFSTSSQAKALKNDAAKQKAFDLKNLVSMTEDAIDMLTEADKKKDAIKKIGDAREEAVKAADEAVKNADKNAVYNLWEKAKGRAILKATQYDASKVIRQVASHSFSVGRAVVALNITNKGKYTKKGA